MHLANTEEDALNFLFLGDTNRAIAETPMNQASSRSHCVFTISLEAREVKCPVWSLSAVMELFRLAETRSAVRSFTLWIWQVVSE
jgi:hypothetical protein